MSDTNRISSCGGRVHRLEAGVTGRSVTSYGMRVRESVGTGNAKEAGWAMIASGGPREHR